MPIYDYVCSNCRHVTEVIHGINDPAPNFCPNCGFEGTLRKAMVSPAIHFKGSGWAKKDRSSTSGTKSKGASSPADSSSSSDPTPGSESKKASSDTASSSSSSSSTSTEA